MNYLIWKQHESRRDFLRLAAGAAGLPILGTARRRIQPPGGSECDVVEVAVRDLRKRGPERDEVAMYLHLLGHEWLSGPAADFFGGESPVQKYIDGLLNYNLLAVARIKNLSDRGITINAFVSICGSTVPAGEAAWVVNLEGEFFPETRSGISKSELAAARTTMLLHELGHALGAPGILPDLKNHRIGLNNTRIVKKHCQTAIDAAARWFSRK